MKPKPKIKRNTGEKHSSFRWDHGDQIFLTKKEKEERDKEVKK